jgi:hypothetical protein
VRAVGGLYTMVLAKPGCSEQKYRLALAQGFAATGVVTISVKMELFWALCRGGVEITCGYGLVESISGRVMVSRRN